MGASGLLIRNSVRRRAALIAALTVALALTVAQSPAVAGVANQGLPHASHTNPLAGMKWGVYTGPNYNSIYPNYQQASGRNRQLLAKIALKPQVFAFGAWDPDSEAKSVAQDFISVTTHGNPAVLSQVAIFRLDPWEGQACPNGSWNAANQQSYKTWINNFAAGIGSARVALVLQPDLPFAVCAPSPVPLELRRLRRAPLQRAPAHHGVHRRGCPVLPRLHRGGFDARAGRHQLRARVRTQHQ